MCIDLCLYLPFTSINYIFIIYVYMFMHTVVLGSPTLLFANNFDHKQKCLAKFCLCLQTASFDRCDCGPLFQSRGEKLSFLNKVHCTTVSGFARGIDVL